MHVWWEFGQNNVMLIWDGHKQTRYKSKGPQ